MPQAVLQTLELTKRYGSLTAVDGLSLEVFPGEVFGFLGPNGAGKTTSIHMMCGLLKPDAGQVLLNGRRIDSGDPAWRCRIGMCPQQVIVWPKLTCAEQLQFMGQMYGLSGAEARRRVQHLLEALDLVESRHSLAAVLSGGMQRRLNLALALVHDPEILVLDEPEAGLDPQSRVLVREYIQSLARKKTVILTTHNMDEAERVAERVAIIDHGRLLVVDTPQALKQRLGQGDVVEVGVRNADLSGLQAACQAALAAFSQQVVLDEKNRTLHLRALNALRLLPAILEALARAGVQPGEVSVRANSLEDVFIHLTGRQLRD